MQNYNNAINRHEYIIIEEIGKGSYGTMYKVQSKINKQDYALKLILYGTETREKNAFREIDCGKEFNHRNVLKFFEYFFDNDHLNSETKCVFQIMELCKMNLSEWFKSDEGINRTDSVCVQMFCYIALGLKYIHEMGFIHCTLKSDNVLISYNNICKISNFELAVLQTEKLANETKIFTRGTTIYSSPEQTDNKTYDFKADIFSLGCIFIEFYTEFKSYYELFHALSNLRNGQLPLNFFAKYKTKIILRYECAKIFAIKMTEYHPNNRLSMEEVINNLFLTMENKGM